MSEIIAFPEDSYDFSSDEVGSSLAGIIARDVAGNPREGILPSAPSLLTGRSDWQVDVAPFIGVSVEDRVVRLGGSDGVMQVTLEEPPVSGGRIDRICWAPQMGTPPLHVVTGAPSSTPLPPAKPVGTISLGTTRLDAGDTSTLQGEFVSDFPFTTTAGGVLTLRTVAELAAWTPADGAQAYCIQDQGGYVRRAGAWQPNEKISGPTSYVATVTGYEAGWQPVIRAQYTRTGNVIEVELWAETERPMVRLPGAIFVSLPVPIASSPISVEGSGFFLAGPVAAKNIYELAAREATTTQVVLEFLRTDGRAAIRVPPQQVGLAPTDVISWRARLRYTTG